MRAIVPSIGYLLAVLAPLSICRADSPAPISAAWRLIENRPDNTFRAELTLRNDSARPLPQRWSLYFNSSSRLLPESVDGPTMLEHINGDFFALRPSEDFPPLSPGAECKIAYTGSPWAINVSDAPNGFYFVAQDESGADQPPRKVSLRVAPFPEAKLVFRGAADQVPAATPASRFAENEKLSLLPVADLPHVLPTPVSTTKMTGDFTIDARTVIVHDASLAGEARFLVKALKPLLGVSLKTAKSSSAAPNSIRLRIGEVEVAGNSEPQGDEAYLLKIDPAAGIEIVGSDAAGVFYGVQSLRALVPIAAYREPRKELVVDAVRIADAPRFPYRGMHLDVARNFQSKETVKKLLNLMAFYKLNRFHWHLSDDEGWRIEIKALPELTGIGGRRGHTADESQHLIPSLGSGPIAGAEHSSGSGHYSQDDVIEILRFAAERHIQVIPELDVPGHSRAAIKAMAARARKLTADGRGAESSEFLLTDPGDISKYESVQMWKDNVIDVGLDSAYRFVDVVVGELADVYRRAGVPLEKIHLGGDEVPDGAWEQSPACQAMSVDTSSGLTRNQELQLHFLDRACDLLAKRGIRPACWDDCLLFATTDGRIVAEVRDASQPRPLVYVWNNVWGWGREDAAYKLANAGYDVVLCNATHLYLDLACEKDPEETGYYWAGFVGDRQPFEFDPLDVFQNAVTDTMGNRLSADQFADHVRLTDTGRHHVVGIQGELWGENLRSRERLEYMAFPRLIAVAERAWAHAPSWTRVDDPQHRREQVQMSWNRFANALGQRELPRLDFFDGGVEYRLPPPGAVVRDGQVLANVAFPGLTVRFTTDDSVPSADSNEYTVPVSKATVFTLRTFDTRGRGSRAVAIPISGQE